jgi:hypothetical protein
MIHKMKSAETAARVAMGHEPNDPLPPGPNYGPFGYFRAAILIFAVVVAILALMAVV